MTFCPLKATNHEAYVATSESEFDTHGLEQR